MELAWGMDGRAFFTMEWVEGAALPHHVQESGLRGALRVLGELARAIEFIHRAGMVHMDLKPAHIIVAERVRLLDPGLAAEIGSRPVEPGDITGTLPYVAPEVLQGRCVDGRADLFSLGVLLLELVLGRPPFLRATVAETARSIMDEDPLPALAASAWTSPPLERLLRRLLDKDPTRRIASAAETAEELESLLATLEPDAADTANLSGDGRWEFPTPFVGRAAILRRCEDRAQVRRSEEGLTLLLTGDHGVGKSVLLNEIIARLAVAGHATARIDLRRGGVFSLERLARILELWLGQTAGPAASSGDTSVSEWAEPADEALLHSDPVVRIGRLIARLPRDCRILLAIDGVESADAVARRFLQSFVAVPTGLPLLFLLAAASPEVDAPLPELADSPLVERFHLEPLEATEITTFVHRLFGSGPGSRDLVRLVFDASGGNPLFAREYLGWLLRTGTARMLPGGGAWIGGDPGIPQALTELLGERVELLDGAKHHLLACACVLRAPFSQGLLLRMSGADSATLRQLLLLGLLRRLEDGTSIEVASQALRVAVLERGGTGAVRSLHERIVAAVEHTGVPAGVDADGLLAYHCLELGAFETAAGLALRAGERARQRGEWVRAADLFEIMRAAVEGPRRMPMAARRGDSPLPRGGNDAVAQNPLLLPNLLPLALARLGESHLANGDLLAACGAFERLLAEHVAGSGDIEEGEIAAARRRLALLYTRFGRLDEAQELLAVNLVCAAPEGVRAGIARLRVLELKGDLLEALAAADELEQRFGNLGDTPEGGELANVQGNILTALDRYEEALEAFERSLAIRRRGRQPQALANTYNNLAILAWRRGDTERALDYGTQALSVWEGSSDIPGAAESLNTLGVIFAQEGRTQEALDCFARCLTTKREHGELRGAAAAANNMAILQMRVGEGDAALRLYRIAEELRRALGDREGLAQTLNNIGLAHARLEQWDAAARAYDESLELKSVGGDDRGVSSTLGNLGTVHLHWGEWQRAEGLFEQRLERARAAGSDELMINATESLALLATRRGDLRRGKRLWTRVLDHRHGNARKQPLIDTLVGLAELCVGSHDHAHAAELLAEASTLAVSVDDPRRHCNLAICNAQLEIERGDLAAALAALNRARLFGAGLSSALIEGTLLKLEGRLRLARGENIEAERALSEALHRFDEAGYRFEGAGVRQQLALLLRRQGLAEEASRMIAEVQRIHAALGVRTDVGGRVELEKHEQTMIPSAAPRAPLATTVLHRIAGLFATSREIGELMAETLDLLLAEVNAECGLVLLMNRVSGEFEVHAERNMDQGTIIDAEKISRNIVNKVYQRDEVLYSSDAQADDRFKEFKSLVRHRILSFICAPVRSRGVILGTIYVDNRSFMSSFQEEDAELCKAFAAIAGMALENASLREEITERNLLLEQEVERRYSYGNIVGKSKEMARVFDVIEKVKEVTTSILIQGETGTGKELIARAIHFNSQRKAAPFVAVDCGILHENLIESELFGHVKGGFTGATADRKGLVELAQDGTLFLDEIGNLDLALQAKLLRVLQEGEYRPIGSAVSKRTNTRFICATNEDLRAMVEAGRFREDLYFRINVVSIRVPPLRERPDDIQLIAEHLIANKAAEAEKQIASVDPAIMEAFFNYPWPGNVREMANTVERLVVLSSSGRLEYAHLPPEIAEHGLDASRLPAAGGVRLSDLNTMEKNAILAALEHAEWNQTHAAQILGLTERNLRYKMKKHRIVNIHARRGRRSGAVRSRASG
jgi:Nif-specific regulatory protein